MIKIEGTQITMTRGDTLELQLDITCSDGTPYVPEEGDSIRFALKRSYFDEECLILKQIPMDTLKLRLESNETKALERPNTYVYDIQLTTADGTVDTFIANASFTLTEEVE